MRARAFRRPDDRAQIVGVGNAVQQDQEGLLFAGLRQLQHVFQRAVVIGGRKGQHALMIVGNGVQTGAVHFLHGNVAFLGHLHDLPGGAAELAAGDQQLLDVASALERLPDGIAAAEQILVGHHVRLGLRGGGGLIGSGRGVAELVVAAFLAAPAGLALLVVGSGSHVAAPFFIAGGVLGKAILALLGLGAELAAFRTALAALLSGTGAVVALAGIGMAVAAVRLAVAVPMVAIGLAAAVKTALLGTGAVMGALAFAVPAVGFAKAVLSGVVAALVVKAAPILGHGLFFPAGLSLYVFIKCHVVSCFLFWFGRFGS